MGKNDWMITISLENFRITRDTGFKVQGVKASERKRAQRMQPEDRLLFYIEDIQKFGAVATVTSACFEDAGPVWKAADGKEKFPYRVQVQPNYVVDEKDFLDAKQISPRLDYVKKWVPELWPLAFQGNLHLLPKRDFNLIETEMKKLVRGSRGGKGNDPDRQDNA